ncbi:MAG: hypothetical protein AAGA54_10445 [Myxococcota bacterium]
MLRRHCCLPLLSALALWTTACFGEYVPAQAGSSGASGTDTDLPTNSTAAASTGASSSSSGGAPLCEHADILILTDVSVSMAPFATGIFNVILALGAQFEATLADVGSYRIGVAFNAPPVINATAFGVPEEAEQCTRLGSLVRGQDPCVEEFGSRPYLTEQDELGGGITCIASGFFGGGLPPEYERPRILDSLVEILEAEDDPELSVCNAGFHQAPDPLFIIVIADAEDESDLSVVEATARAIGSQGTSLRNVGIFVIGADGNGCPDDLQEACGADPVCRLQEFIVSGFNNANLDSNVRRFNICRSLEDDPADVAADLLVQLSAVLFQVCGRAE